jgi:uncharacterized protein YegJ (DUF2314 family)
MTEEEEKEHAWLEEQLHSIHAYLRGEGIVVQDLSLEISLPPVFSLWCDILPGGERTMWILSGDCPHDYLVVDGETSERDVVRIFSERWFEASESMSLGQRHATIKIGNPDGPDELRSLGQLLKDRAESLKELFEGDNWLTEADIAEQSEKLRAQLVMEASIIPDTEACSRALATFRFFWRELEFDRRGAPSLDLVCVKVLFRDAAENENGYVEGYVWIEDIHFDGEVIEGTLIGSYDWGRSLKHGDGLRVPMAHISDWMYVLYEQVIGGHTINLRRSSMDPKEREAHDQQWGLDFGDPNRILLVPEECADNPCDPADGPHPGYVANAGGFAEFLKADPQRVNERNEVGCTSLHSQALAGATSWVEVLLAAGADPNAKNDDGRTPVELAEFIGWPEIVAILKADPRYEPGHTVPGAFAPSAIADSRDVLVEFLTESVSQGVVFNPGESIRYGWMWFIISDDVTMAVEAPQLFKTPFEFQPDVSDALNLVLRQRYVCDSFGLEMLMCNFRQTCVCLKGLKPGDSIFMNRTDLAKDHVSGWYVGSNDSELDPNDVDNLELRSLWEITCDFPQVAEFWMLPLNWQVVFEPDPVVLNDFSPVEARQGSYLTAERPEVYGDGNEDAWLEEQLHSINAYLRSEKLVVENLSVAFSLPPVLSFWYTTSPDGEREIWIISGDCPHHYMVFDGEMSVREVMKEFSDRWFDVSNSMCQGRQHATTKIGNPEDPEELRSLGQLLKSRAELLKGFSEDDDYWSSEEVAAEHGQQGSVPTHQGDWATYMCLVDDAPALILIDLDYARERPPLDSLYFLGIDILDPGEHGLGTEAEADLITPLVDSIVDKASNCGLLFVGRMRKEGIWELTFYGTDGLYERLEHIATTVLETTGRGIGVGSHEDAEWAYYDKILFPDPERLQWIMNHRLVHQLVESGDKIESLRPIDHCAVFSHESGRDSFAKAVQNRGFQTSVSQIDDYGHGVFSIEFQRDGSPELDGIHDLVMELRTLVEQCSGVYTGWGCPLVLSQAEGFRVADVDD